MSKEYDRMLEQAKKMHKHPNKWPGKSLIDHLPFLERHVKENEVLSILDYGCGKAQNHPHQWQHIITKYDPAVPGYRNKPSPDFRYDLVICTDVLEHIPMEDIPRIIDEIMQYVKPNGMAYLSICCRPAWQKLPDGSNAHATVMPPMWWNKQFEPWVEIKQFIVKYNGIEYWGNVEKACGVPIQNTVGMFWLDNRKK